MHGACNNLSKNKVQGIFLMLLKVMHVQEKKIFGARPDDCNYLCCIGFILE